MKKFIAIIALAGVAVFSAACESTSDKTGSTTATTTAPAVTKINTPVVDYRETQCDSLTDQYMSRMRESADLLNGMSSSEQVAAYSSILDLYNQAKSTGETLLETCGSYMDYSTKSKIEKFVS